MAFLARRSAAQSDFNDRYPLPDGITLPPEYLLRSTNPSGKSNAELDPRSFRRPASTFDGFDTRLIESHGEEARRASGGVVDFEVGPLDTPRLGPVDPSWPSRGSADTSSPQYASGLRRFEENNIQIELPGNPWIVAPFDVNNPSFCLVLIDVNSQLTFMLLANRSGIENDIDNHKLAEMSQQLVLARAPDAQFSRTSPIMSNGLEGIRYGAELTANGMALHFCVWSASRQGYVYHLITSGPVAQRASIDAANAMFCARIQLIDPSRVAHVDDSKLIGHYESKSFGYRVELTGAPWQRISDLTEIDPLAEFGAEQRDAAFLVTPVPLPGRQPDLESLTKVMLGRMNIVYPGTEITDVQPCRIGALQGQEVRVKRRVGSLDLAYRLRVVSDAHCAYLIWGWAASGDRSGSAQLADGMDHVEIDAGESSAEIAPRSDAQRKALGLFFNELGIESFLRGDYVAALDFLKCGMDHDPNNERLIENYAEIAAKLDRHDEAIRLIEHELPRFPNDVQLRGVLARIVAENGDSDRARQLYADAFAKGYADESALEHYLSLAIDAKSFDEAISVVGSVAQRKPTVFVQSSLAALYTEKGDYEKAILMLHVLHQRHPTNLATTLELVRAYEGHEQYDTAMQLTQELVDKGKQDEVILLYHGRNQLNLKRYAEAKQTFERAVGLYPQSSAVHDMLKVASNLLGEGDNTALRTPLVPVPIPPVVSAALYNGPTQPASNLDKYGAEELIRLTGLAFRANEPLRTTCFCRVKIHTPGGVSRYSNLTFEFDPSIEKFYVNRLEVFDAQGKTVAQGNVNQYYISDEKSSGVATQRKIVNVPVPGLKPGHFVEWMTTREDRYPTDTFPFQETILTSSVPVGISAFYVQGEVGKLKYSASQPVSLSVAEDVLLCTQINPAPLRAETKQLSYEQVVPVLWVGDANATWEGIAADYQTKIADRLMLDEATQQLALQLTASCSNNRDRLTALAAYVQRTLSYQAIEFGRRARVPNSAGKSLQLKYGDCKDHSLLLRQLLAAVDIPSHLAVVNSEGIFTPELPSLDQFDHMILFVPGESVGEPNNTMGGFLVDVTEKDANPLLVPPFGLVDRTVLILDPARPRLMRTPHYPADAGQLLCRRTVEVLINPQHPESIEANVREQLTVNQYLAPGLRYYLRMFESGERQQAMQDLLSSDRQVIVKQFDVENLDETAAPLVLRLQYVLPNSFHQISISNEAHTLVGQIPCGMEATFLDAGYDDARVTPFQIRLPMFVHTSVEFQLPAGYRLADTERWTATGQSKFVAWASQARQVGQTIHAELQIRTAAGKFPAHEYSPYCASMKESLSLLQAPLTLRDESVELARHTELLRQTPGSR
jgi:tetratricopeptide (TPR) repeat protein